MEIIERDPHLNAGYEAMVFIQDENGAEFSCTLDTAREGVRSLNDLSAHERTSCMNVSSIADGRW